jgi:hypothetical protein
VPYLDYTVVEWTDLSRQVWEDTRPLVLQLIKTGGTGFNAIAARAESAIPKSFGDSMHDTSNILFIALKCDQWDKAGREVTGVIANKFRN